jgi:hypothetical protein
MSGSWEFRGKSLAETICINTRRYTSDSLTPFNRIYNDMYEEGKRRHKQLIKKKKIKMLKERLRH